MNLVLIGYGGHAQVVGQAWLASGHKVVGYCQKEPAILNPLNIPWLGHELDSSTQRVLSQHWTIAAVGNNALRMEMHSAVGDIVLGWATVKHPSAVVSETAVIGLGVYIGAGTIINTGAIVEDGCILNSGSIIEHGTRVGAFSHIGPGATLCGDVDIGRASFIGASTVVREGIAVGSEVLIGAGSVVNRNVDNGSRVAGNPIRDLP